MSRRLVTVRRIAALGPIAGADRIQLATVDGWKTVVSVSEFAAPGERGLYFEIDSFLPATDLRWSHLAASFTIHDGTKGFRVRTAKIRGQLSQGLLMPLALFPEVAGAVERLEAALGPEAAEASLAADLSFEHVLGVTKCDVAGAETEKKLGPGFLGPIPDFIPKAGQKRIQNMSASTLDSLRDAVFQETTKLDGTSMTVYFVRADNIDNDNNDNDNNDKDNNNDRNDYDHDDQNDDRHHHHPAHLPQLTAEASLVDQQQQQQPTAEAPPVDQQEQQLTAEAPPVDQQQQQHRRRFGVCSRNCDLADRAGSLYWETARRLCLPATLARLGRSVALQGELCGSAIQQNRDGFPPGYHDFFLFAVYDIDRAEYVDPREVEQEWAPRLGVRHVPVNGYVRLGDVEGATLDGFLRRADGVGINGRKREGVVYKQVGGGGCRTSFKVISNSYLLKHGE